MKKVLMILAVLAMTGIANAELLTNGGFETGDLTGWNLGAPTQSVSAPVVGAYEGNFALSLIALSDGVPEINQGSFFSGNPIPASPGQEFNLSGYMLTETALPAVGTGATFGLFKIVFEDVAGNDLAPASVSIGQFGPGANPGVEALAFLDGDSPVNTWIFSEAQGVAPAGTASVQFLALNVDFGNGANHPMWYDDVSATLIPEPATLLLLSMGGLLSKKRK